jgi:TonB family protein
VKSISVLLLLFVSHSALPQTASSDATEAKTPNHNSTRQNSFPKRVWTDEQLAAARTKAKRNSIILHVVVDEAGRVISSKVVQGLGYPFDGWARQATSGWRFRPATKDGRPVMVKVQIEVDPDKAPRN